eukprot:713985-Pyramimonas_sp.AAC.1
MECVLALVLSIRTYVCIGFMRRLSVHAYLLIDGYQVLKVAHITGHVAATNNHWLRMVGTEVGARQSETKPRAAVCRIIG